MATVLSESPWKCRVTCYSELSSSPDIHGHHRFRQASNWAFNTAFAFAVPLSLNTIAWKTYFIFGSFFKIFAAFLQVYFMYPETVGRKLKTCLANATRSPLVRLERTLKEVVEKSKNLPVTFFFLFF